MSPIDIEKLADAILLKIRRRRGRPVSLSSLAKSLKAGHDDLDAALNILKALGYKIRRRKEAVTFVAAADSLTETEVAYELKTKLIGSKIFAYRSVKSTNDIAAQLAQSGAPEGTVIVADQQTQGRGRLGRTWHSPAGCGIYVSIILKPRFKPEKAPGLAIMAALALADAISSLCPGDVKIKWPNDVLIGNRKVAGILTELSAERNEIDHVVIGVGINVNHKIDDFPPELRSLATSIRTANRRKASRVELLKRFLQNFEKEYHRYKKDQLAAARKRIREYSSLLGRNVQLRFGNRTVEGTAVDIDATGALILEKDGVKRPVTSGEVSVVKK